MQVAASNLRFMHDSSACNSQKCSRLKILHQRVVNRNCRPVLTVSMVPKVSMVLTVLLVLLVPMVRMTPTIPTVPLVSTVPMEPFRRGKKVEQSLESFSLGRLPVEE